MGRAPPATDEGVAAEGLRRLKVRVGDARDRGEERLVPAQRASSASRPRSAARTRGPIPGDVFAPPSPSRSRP